MDQSVMSRRPILERLLSRVEIDPGTGCWLWQGAVGAGGYGNIALGRSKYFNTHRVAYVEMVGPIPEGLHLDHLCKVRRCCNPDHLEPVTPRENVLRGVGFSAVNAQKTHCPRGHPLEGDNLKFRSNRPTHRECRECDKARKRVGSRRSEAPKEK